MRDLINGHARRRRRVPESNQHFKRRSWNAGEQVGFTSEVLADWSVCASLSEANSKNTSKKKPIGCVCFTWVVVITANTDRDCRLKNSASSSVAVRNKKARMENE